LSVNLQLIAPGVSSCNTPKVEISKLANWEKITPDHTVAVLKPRIDTIAFTIKAEAAFGYLLAKKPTSNIASEKVYKDYWSDFAKNLSSIALDETEPDVEWYKGKSKISKYRKSVFINVGESKRVLLSTDPATKQLSPLRIEFSALNFGAGELQTLQDIWLGLDLGHIPFELLWKDAKITRLDIALDILNLHISDLFVFKSNAGKSWIASDLSTGMQTQQFYKSASSTGSPYLTPNKRADLLLYDKRAQQQGMGQDPQYGDTPHIRLEACVKSTTQKLSNLKSLKYPFSKWDFRHPVKLSDPFDDWIWRLLFDSVRVRGWAEAKKLIPAEYWKQVEGDLQAFTKNTLIRKEKIWKYWPEALSSSVVGTLISWAGQPFDEISSVPGGSWHTI